MQQWLYLLGLVLLFSLILIALLKGKNVKISKDEVILGNDSKPKSPHRNCKHNGQIILVFKHRDEINEKIYHIKNIDLMKEIMNSAESSLDRIYTIIKGWYLSLLKQSGIEKKYVADSKEFHEFTVILEAIYPHLKMEVKRMALENHFIERELNNSWENYVNQKTQGLIDLYTELLNNYYKMESPTRVEVFSYMNPKLYERDSVSQIIEDTIREFLSITKRCDNKIKELEKIKDDEFNALFI